MDDVDKIHPDTQETTPDFPQSDNQELFSPAITEQTLPATKNTTYLRRILLLTLTTAFSLALVYSAVILYQQRSSSPAEENNSNIIVHRPIPTPDPIKNWDIYANSKYHYTVMIPDSLSANNSGQNNSQEDIVEFTQKIEGSTTSFNIKISSWEISEELYQQYKLNAEESMSKNITSYQGTLNKKDIVIVSSLKTSVDGLVAYSHSIESENSYLLSTLLKKDKLIYTLQFITSDLSKKDLGEKIIATFKFLNQNTDNVFENFECPESKVLDCSPCTGDRCPLNFPMYCSKGSVQYNWIIEHCPGIEIVGIN